MPDSKSTKINKRIDSIMRSFSRVPGIQIVAVADVDSIKQMCFRNRVEECQVSLGLAPRCDMYEQYKEILERCDIDAVEVVTPDHWHVLMTIHAFQAGKPEICTG